MDRKSRWALGAFSALYLLHGFFILFYAFDLPFMDEWEVLRPQALPAGFRFSWLIAQHNEHRIFLTKVQTWILYAIDGWDLRVQQATNYILFAAILWVLCKVSRRVFPEGKFYEYLGFLVFLLSPLLHQNHMWAFQSQFHFALLFFLSAGLLLFDPRQRPLHLAAGTLCVWLATFSFSNGLVACTALCGVFALFKFNAFIVQKRSRDLWELAAVGLALLSGLVFWFHGFHRDPSFTWAYPNNPLFWRFFLNLVSLGFGANSENVPLAALFFVFAWVPVAALLKKRKVIWLNASEALLIGLLAGLYGALATIALGRGTSILGSKASRYAEFAVTLVPLTYLAWRKFLGLGPRAHRFVAIFWGVMVFSFMDDWNMVRPYRSHQALLIRGSQCIKDYDSGLNPTATCPELYPAPLKERIEAATALKMSFRKKD